MPRPKYHSNNTKKSGDKTPPVKHSPDAPKASKGVRVSRVTNAYVYGDRCEVCGEPLYTSKKDLITKWCSDPNCGSHRRNRHRER